MTYDTAHREMQDSVQETPQGRPEEDSLWQFLEQAPDALVMTNQQGNIMLVNRQAELLFGYRREELLGQPIELLLPDRFRQRHVGHRAQFSAHPHARPMGIGLDLYGRRNDGREFPVEISLSPITWHGEMQVMSAIRDVSERKRAEVALLQAEQLARAAVETRRALLQFVIDELPSGVYLVRGHDARLALANRAAESVWGAHWQAGQPMMAFLDTNNVRILGADGRELRDESLATLRAVRSGQAVRNHQEIIRRPDGEALPVLLNAIAFDTSMLGDLLDGEDGASSSAAEVSPASADSDGSADPTDSISSANATGTSGALIVLQDMTAIKEAERLKDEFITIAAHELRTPLAAVKGYADMLIRQTARQATPGEEMSAVSEDSANLAKWQIEALDSIGEATNRLTQLTDDLLDVTRLQAGRLALHIEPHDLVALARRVLRRMQVTTTAHQLTLAADAAPIVVNIDVHRIEQTLTNLIGNAIKYSPAGGEINTTLHAGDGMAIVAVQDHGIGIPADQQGDLFGRFARASNALALGIGGTGLGLYLCRELIERHGGRIWFASTEGGGSTFCFSLPLTPLTGD